MIPRTLRRSPKLAALVAVVVALATGACAGPAAPQPATPASKGAAVTSSSTVITTFAVSNENLNVDKVGLRDGFLRPDGSRDLAFTATIDGPYEALFLVSASAKGEPGYGLRADTLTGNHEVPDELGGIIDSGKMTVGIGVVEHGKFINGESGSAHGGAGTHELTLYVPNTATLRPGSHVRLYAKTPAGPLVAGPTTPY